MKKYILLTLLTILIGAASVFSGVTIYKPHNTELIEDGMQSIVTIDVGDHICGTAFYIGDGLFVTAGHMLKAPATHLTFEDGTKLGIQETFLCEDYDVGFYKTAVVDKPALEFDAVPPRRGDTVYVLGNPTGVPYLASKGIVRGWDKETDFFGDVVLVVIDAACYAGNSGSPVLDEDGEVKAVYVGGKITPCQAHIEGLSSGIMVPDILRAMRDLGIGDMENGS